MMNSLNTQFGANSSLFRADRIQSPQSDSNQGNQGISEQQLDQLLTIIIMFLLNLGNKANEGKGDPYEDGSGDNGPQNGSLSPITLALMSIIGDIIQSQNGGGLGGGLNTGFSLASNTGPMQ